MKALDSPAGTALVLFLIFLDKYIIANFGASCTESTKVFIHSLRIFGFGAIQVVETDGSF